MEYFTLNSKDASIARAEKDGRYPSLEQVKHVVMSMPSSTDIERRNRALVAFTILTGIRDRATVSLKLKHIDIIEELVTQDPAEVQTKFSKRIDTYFFPVGDEFRQTVIDWVKELREQKLYGYDAPLFPRTNIALDHNSRTFKVMGIEPAHWNNTEPVRKVFRDAFLKAGLPYYNPHSFRKTLVQFGYKACKTHEELKAWSQNLGHESMLTTFTSYGKIDRRRQGDIIRRMIF